nr:hypothetical protein MFMH1_22520 [Myxococcus sp. MH1]
MGLSRWGTCLLALMFVACGDGVGLEPPSEATQGTLRLPLTAQSPEGAVKLVGATFNITGAQTVFISDTSADTLTVPLIEGDYTIELGGSWHLERLSAPGTPLSAQRLSPSVLAFSVIQGKLTEVRYLFKLAGSGGVDVGIQVDNGGSISGTLTFTQHEGPPDSEFASLVGKSVPFVISFETSRVVREGGGPKAISVETGPIFVQFGGPDGALLEKHVSPFFKGRSFLFRVTSLPNGYQVLSTFLIEGVGSGAPLDFVSHESQPFRGTVDPGGYPETTPFEFQSTMVFSLHAFGDLSGTFTGTVVPK